MINSFSGEYRFLSNFFESRFEYEGISYTTAEHAFQQAKTLDPEWKQIIRSCPTPALAKRAGRSVKLRSDWEEVKDQIMEDILRAKFTQNSYVLRALINTGDEELVEGNTWNDTYWGVCDGEGKNMLGKMLMKIRSELQEG